MSSAIDAPSREQPDPFFLEGKYFSSLTGNLRQFSQLGPLENLTFGSKTFRKVQRTLPECGPDYRIVGWSGSGVMMASTSSWTRFTTSTPTGSFGMDLFTAGLCKSAPWTGLFIKIFFRVSKEG